MRGSHKPLEERRSSPTTGGGKGREYKNEGNKMMGVGTTEKVSGKGGEYLLGGAPSPTNRVGDKFEEGDWESKRSQSLWERA